MDKSVDIVKLRAPFPPEALKQRTIGGGKKATYVEVHTVINRLNAACPEWNFSVLRTWQDDNVLMAHVELTIPGLGSRQHVGVQLLSPGAGEDMRKGHVSDALKKCATLFGVGLELYGDDYEAAPDPRKAAWYEFKRKSFDIGMGEINDDGLEEWAFYTLGMESTGPGTLSAEQLVEAATLLPAAYAATKVKGVTS